MKVYKDISQLSKQYSANKIMLFGSRARGDNRQNSDIDIAVFGMPEENQAKFSFEVEELDTLLSIDIVFVNDLTNKLLLENIKRDGVSLMDKFYEKYAKLKDVVSRLEEAITESQNFDSSIMRDGVIQRFEFCTELAWKTIREKLIDEGLTEVNTPKSALKKAFEAGIVTEETLWIELLNDRNLTSHIYDEITAVKIYNRIKDNYLTMFMSLIENLD